MLTVIQIICDVVEKNGGRNRRGHTAQRVQLAAEIKALRTNRVKIVKKEFN